MYADFNRALPVPDFTRRDGVLNLYSHVGAAAVFKADPQFPAGPTRPDIGPKMYNAFAA
jgi:lysine-specific demethylase 3